MTFNVQKWGQWYTKFHKSPYHGKGRAKKKGETMTVNTNCKFAVCCKLGPCTITDTSVVKIIMTYRLYYTIPALLGDMNHKLRLIANCTQFAIVLRWISIVRLIALLLSSAATVACCRMRMPNACWSAPSPTPLLCVSCVTVKKNWLLTCHDHFCFKISPFLYVHATTIPVPIIQTNIWISISNSNIWQCQCKL